jgi:ribosomal protein L37E
MASRISRDQFIANCIAVHGDRYDYSLVDYKNTKTDIKIICRVHGVFTQTAGRHTHAKAGCNACGYTKASVVRITDWDKRLSDFREIHGDRYEYDGSSYTKRKAKMRMICKTHGDFMQSPCRHYRGDGCPSCSIRGGFRPYEDGFVYVIESDDKAFVKIGVANDAMARIKFLKWITPFDISMRSFFLKHGADVLALEKKARANLMSAGFRGFNGATEWFRHDEEEIRRIEEFLA